MTLVRFDLRFLEDLIVDGSQKMTAFEARTRFGELLDRARYSHQPCLIERHGKVVAALVDIETFERLMLPQKYEKWVQDAVDRIKTRYAPKKIVLFGSVAMGQVHPGSDIDLLIVKETGKKLTDRIEEVLSLVPAENPIEPHVFTPTEIEERLALQDPFVTNALRQGRVLYEV